MRNAIRVFVLAGTALPRGASGSDYCRNPELLNLEELDAKSEAEKEAKMKKPRLRGVQGFALITPGAPGISYCWERAGLVRVIPGTGDEVCDAEHERLQEAARAFAESFDRNLIESVPRLKGQRCAVESK